MKNNLRIKMMAWIMSVVMLLCTVPALALADSGVDSEPLSLNQQKGSFFLNGKASCDLIIKKGNQVLEDLSNAVVNTEYEMKLLITKKTDAVFPDNSSMYYKLPDEIYSVSQGSNSDVSWEKRNSYLVIDWVGEKQDAFDITATVKIAKMYDLYNIANINGLYYRLAKTKIWTSKVLEKNLGKKLAATDYSMEDYDFANTIITVNGIEYAYDCEKNADIIRTTGKSYTVKFDNMDVVKEKIGAMDASGNPRWLVPEEDRYGDNNKTNSYHANYTITLHAEPYEQDLYNMLKVDDKTSYYRLRKTRIIAREAREYKDNTELKPGEYTLIPNEDYDFTNVLITIDGEIYKYSDHELDGDFESYYTVQFDRVVKKDHTHSGDKGAEWLNNESGWLDGANYVNEGNDVPAFHRDYRAVTHKGRPVVIEEEPVVEENPAEEGLSIVISSDWPADQTPYYGLKITLYGKLIGFENKNYKLQWQNSIDGDKWDNVSGANGLSYTYTLNEQTAKMIWRLVANDISDK